MDETAGALAVAAVRPLLEAGTGGTAELRWQSGARLRLTLRDDGERGLRLQSEEPLGAIGLERTPQPFGGVCWWLRCPECGHRRRTLYLAGTPARALTGSLPRCRPCRRLAYPSQRLGPVERLQRHRRRLADRIAGHPIAWGALPARPRGMHHTRYERELDRLQAIDTALEARFLADATRLLGRIRR